MMHAGLISRDGYYAHPTAIVDDGAVVGRGTRLFHYAQVAMGAVVGEGCTIGRCTCVHDGAIVGNRCNIQSYVTVPKGLVLEDEVFCATYVGFTNVYNPRAGVPKKDEYRTTYVERGATFGVGAIVICGSGVGTYAMVGAGAVVTRDVRPYALVVGNPAKQVAWVTRTGEIFKRRELVATGNSSWQFITPKEPGVIYRVSGEWDVSCEEVGNECEARQS